MNAARARWRTRARLIVLVTFLPGLILPGIFVLSLLEFTHVRGRLPRGLASLEELHLSDGLVSFLIGQKLRQLARLPKQGSALNAALADHQWAQDAIHFELPQTSREHLEAALPYSGEAYQPAGVWERGQYYPLKLRHRGNTIPHWLFPRRSVKGRAKKRRLIRGQRELNFTVKNPYKLCLALAIARESGLLAPDTAPVRVFVNGRLLGIQAFVQEIDETFLLSQRRLPGNVFKGESFALTNEFHFGSRPGWLFRDANVWEKEAIDNTQPADARAELELLARLTSSPEPEAARALADLIDREALVRHWAYKLLLDEFHQGDTNNQKWYLDPTNGRFYPIVWDPYFRDNAGHFKDLRKVHRRFSFEYSPGILPEPYYRLGHDPRLVHEVLRHVLTELPSQERVEALADELRVLALRHDRAEPAGEPNPFYTSPSEQLAWSLEIVRANRERLQLILVQAASLVWQASPGKLRVGARGLAGAHLTAFSVQSQGLPTQLPRIDHDRSGAASREDLPLLGRWVAREGGARFVLKEPLLVLPAYTGIDRLLPVPRAYSILLPSGCRALAVEAKNALSGGALGVEELKAWAAEDVDASHPWDLARAEGEAASALVFDHPVHRVEADLHLGPGTSLRIRPGTRVVLAPNVSVVCKGRVLAEGTSQEPISWEPAEEGKPWGVLALQGPGASGSRFRHVTFRGGSRARLERVRYPGMVDVHRARDVRFESCTFTANRLGDDSLRAAHAEVSVLGCRFFAVPGDAIDLDYSEGRIVGCEFEEVGNDGIDLMRSAPRIEGNLIQSCGDKGISIGEGSEPIVVDTRIFGCKVGVQIKDLSEPILVNLTIRKAQVGVLVSPKNWRYGRGGGGWLVNSVLADNVLDLEVQARSRLRVTSSVLEPPAKPLPGRLVLERVSRKGEPAPAPTIAAYQWFAAPPPSPRLGASVPSAAWRARRCYEDRRFRDGFRPLDSAWEAGGRPCYVEDGALVVEAESGRSLRLVRSPTSVLAGSRLHVLIGADPPSQLRIELAGAAAGEPVLLTRVPRWIAVDLTGGELTAVGFRVDSPTKLRLSRFALSVPE